MLDSTSLIRDLVAAPGPPGQEDAVRELFGRQVRELGFSHRTDAKGNLLIAPGAGAEGARIVVTAHLDELALMVECIETDGKIRVKPLGGVLPWKWGEQPLLILTSRDPVPAVLSFGCIHTDSPSSVVQQAREGALTWDQAFLFTGLSTQELEEKRVRPGARAVLDPTVRVVREIGSHLVSYFLDDRADLAAMLLALEELRNDPPAGVLFAATTSEEVGGEGASFLLHRVQPEICVALEIGPSVPESPFFPDSRPTIWVRDSFSHIESRDVAILEEAALELGIQPHWQALSRGGSDASVGSQHGRTARPVTLGLPVENSHGLEIMHRDAPQALARLLVAYLRRVTALPAESQGI